MILNRPKQRLVILGQIFMIIITAHLQAQTMSEIGVHRVTLPNGWQLTPVGKILPLGDLPLNICNFTFGENCSSHKQWPKCSIYPAY